LEPGALGALSERTDRKDKEVPRCFPAAPGVIKETTPEAFGIRRDHDELAGLPKYLSTLCEQRDRIRHMLDNVVHGNHVEAGFPEVGLSHGPLQNLQAKSFASHADRVRIGLYAHDLPSQGPHPGQELSVSAAYI
jgi:hypothetical protein